MIKVNFEEIGKLDYKSNEAYKTLRTNVAFCGKDIKVIVITSTTPGEGKTFVSFNLALSLAEAGKKVILLDADLRKSVLAGRYHIDRAVRGFTHYLTGIYGKEEVIYQTNIENLFIIFAGPIPPNPSELLGNKYSSDLISQLREEYDYVIIDAPPLGSVIDGAIIASNCDGAILVIETNANNRKLILGVKEQLEKTGCKILGAVLNKATTTHENYYGKYMKKNNEKYFENAISEV